MRSEIVKSKQNLKTYQNSLNLSEISSGMLIFKDEDQKYKVLKE